MKNLLELARKPVPAHSFAAFRILFGLILAWEFCRYFHLGRIDRFYLAPSVNLAFKYFEWLPQLPPAAIYALFGALLLCSLLLAAGRCFRPAAVFLFLGYTYSLLVDATNYQNHLYLFSLLLFLLCFLSPHAAWSLDARRDAKLAGYVPAWQPFLLKFQIGIVYIYGGLEKLHPEWLSGRSAEAILPFGNSAVLDALTGILGRAGTVSAFTYGGLLFDFAVIPLLLVAKTRRIGVLGVIGFNLICSQVFTIGVFPWFMIAATVLFIDPGTLLRLAGRALPRAPEARAAVSRGRPALIMAACYCAFQLAFPFRHFLIEGSYLWNAKGRFFSWTMMQCSRDGKIHFYLKDLKSGKEYPVDATRYLTARQIKKMSFNPQAVLRFSVFLQEKAAETGLDAYSIHARSEFSLNGKPRVPYVREDVDLSKVTLRTNVDEILHAPPAGYLALHSW